MNLKYHATKTEKKDLFTLLTLGQYLERAKEKVITPSRIKKLILPSVADQIKISRKEIAQKLK